MIVLADQDNVVWARGAALAEKAIQDQSWVERKGLELTLRKEWVPDDTRFERRQEGGFTLSSNQPDGWNTRRQKESRIYSFMNESEEMLRDFDMPDTVDGTQAANILERAQRILLGHHLLIERLLKESRNG